MNVLTYIMRRTSDSILTKLCLTAALLLAANSLLAGKGDFRELWHNDVEPILDKYCLKCHAGVKQKGGLDLRSLDTMLRGGDSGPALIPGHPEKSFLVQFVHPDAETHMPPDEKKQLSSTEIEAFRKWVAALPKAKDAVQTNSAWVEPYLASIKKSHKPIWNPPAKTTIPQAIDGFLSRSWKAKKIQPAAVADDVAFVRRIHLDLVGRTPTPEESTTFITDKTKNKREILVEKLFDSPEYARHMREVFDVVLMGRSQRRNEKGRRENGWHEYLEESFEANRPWNEFVRDVILARNTNGVAKGAFWFLYERRDNHQAMAEAVAPLAFGADMKCAQCHNHPLAWEIEQRHYWGLVAAFNRSEPVQGPSGPGMSESAIGGFVNFANLKKESQPAVMAFLNGKTIPEERPDANAKEEDKPDLYVVPPKGDKGPAAIPVFSRRQALAEAVTQDNPLLAKAFVNRAWGMLMGRGIVHPVDQIDSKHPPSHPDLLDWLAKDFEKSGYDVKRLMKGIVLSRAYQLSSKPNSGKLPRPEFFACAIEKPLSAEQLLRSTLIATGASEDEAAELRKALTKNFPDVMPVNYNPSLQQALFLSNSPLVQEHLKPKGKNTASKLLAEKDVQRRVTLAFRSILGRSPDSEESAMFKSFLAKKNDDKGVRDLMWALLTSAEFQLNH